MTDREAGQYWERNAETWTLLARQGWDIYRDALNTPAFFSILPDVAGKRGIDVGCGEGHNTRLLTQRGAVMFGVDVAPTFVRLAAGLDSSPPISYVAGTALHLPFPARSFDFATAFMSLMDVPDHGLALQEVSRVLRRGGFLQFSICHPCFTPPHRRLLREHGRAYAVEVGRYFDRIDGQVDRWLFGAVPMHLKIGTPPFEIPIFHRTLSEWITAILDAGFVIEKVSEPRADDETVRRVPALQDTQVVSYFLHVRVRRM